MKRFLEWADEIELGVVSLLCMIGSMMGTRMKWYSKDHTGESYDRKRYLTGLYLAAGAGLVTGLLGQGLHVNKAFLMGSSIVAGYAGGKRFFEWIQKILSTLTMERFHDEIKEGKEALKDIMSDESKSDDENKDGDPP